MQRSGLYRGSRDQRPSGGDLARRCGDESLLFCRAPSLCAVEQVTPVALDQETELCGDRGPSRNSRQSRRAKRCHLPLLLLGDRQ